MAGLHFKSGIDNGFNTDIDKMNAKLNSLTRNVSYSGGKIDSTFKNISKTVGGLVTVMAVEQAGKELINFSKELETSLVEVATISKVVAENQEHYKNVLIGLSTQEDLAASSASDLTKAYYQVVSAGYDGAEGLSVLEASARAATAGFVDVSTSADGITTVLNAFNKTSDEAANVSDIFFKTVEKGKTTFPELGANIAKVAPIAASMGISFEEVSAAIASVTKQGTKTPEALTQLRASMIGVNKVLGDGWTASMTFQEALGEVANRAGGSQNELKALLGTDEAVLAVLALTGKNARGAAEDLNAMNNALGATERAAKLVTETTGHQIKLLSNTILAALEPLGNEAKNVIGSIASSLTEGLESGNVQLFAKTIGVLTAAFVTYKVSLIATTAIRKLMTAAELQGISVTKLSTLANYGLAKSFKSLKLAFAANPVGLIITGLTLAIPLIQHFTDSTDQSREKLDENIKSMLEYNKAQQVSEKSIKSLTDEYISLAKSTDESKEKTDKLKKIEDELQKQRPDIILSTDTFATKLDKIKKAGNEASINIDKLSKAEKGLYESTKLLNKQAATKSLNEAKDAINKSYTVLFAAKEVNLTTEKGREEIIKQTEIESKKLLASQNELDNFKLELGKKKGNGLSITSADKDYLSMLKDEVNKHDEILNQYSEMVTLINNLQIAQKNLDDANAIPKEKTPEEIELERLQLIQDEKDKANAEKLLADKKQEEIDKKNNEKALKALELSNQNTINEIKLNAVKTLKTDDELKKQLLENDLVYLDKKKKLTADNLEKSKITEQIIDTKVAISTLSSETAKQLQDKLDEYKTYLEKRSDIAKKYDEDIKKELDNGYKDRANVAEKQKQSALKAFDESTILQNEQYKEWLNNTLPQIIEDGGEKVKDALQNTRDVLSEKLINEKDPEQILIYQAMIDKLDESIKNLGKKGAEDNNDFKDKIELLNEIRTLTDSFADSLSNGSDNLSVLFKGIGNTIGGIVEMSNAFKLVEEGMGAIEKATVTLAVISAAIKVVNAITNVSSQIQQNKIDANVLEIETQTALNLSLLERNKIEESYFSSQDWSKALNGLDNYNKSLNLQKEALLSIQKNNEKQANTKTDNGIAQTMALSNVNSSKSDLENALSGITYKTKDKGKLANVIGIADEYDSLLNVYPDLIDAEGNLNKELAQTVVNSGKVSEVSKAGLEQLLTYTDEAEKSYAEFGNFISSIFGGVGDSITESFRDAYTNGTDAMEGLGDSMSKMIENFTDKTIQFAFLQPIIDELNNATESLGKDYASGGISSTELQKGIVDELGKFYSDVDGMSTTISDAYKLADELASNAGFDSAFNPSSTDTQTSIAKSGAITQSITEDTGSMIVGRIGAMMLSNERIANYSENALDLAVSNLVMLGKIKDDTSFLPEIAENTRKTYQKLENI